MKLISRFLLPLLLYYLSCHTGNTYSEEQVSVRIRGLLARMLCMQFSLEGNFSKTPPKPHKYPLYEVSEDPCRIINRRICGGSAECRQFRSSRKQPCGEEANILECEYEEHLEADINSPEQRAGASDKSRRWPNRTTKRGVGPVIPVGTAKIPSSLDYLIKKAIDYIEQCTCILFEPKQPTDQDWVFITNRANGCFVNHIGRRSGVLTLNLGKGCENFGIVVHELLHAIGFYHEQSRPDRDQYVTILEENIKPGKEGNFGKISTSSWESFGEKYDYRSVMHYGKSAFAKRKGLITIQVKNSKAQIGQTLGLSKSDIIQLSRMHGCSIKMPNFPYCYYIE